MEIFNVQVYGLSDSIIRSGFPLVSSVGVRGSSSLDDPDWVRAKRLSEVPPGTGHDKFLRGIVVQFDLKAPRYFFQEWDTYHFHESISSQSTMHCISKFSVEDMCNGCVDQRIIDVLKEKIEEYHKNPSPENLRIVKSNVPEGLEVTRGVTTNYAQIKTMHLQRKNHRLPEWNTTFVKFVHSLPMSKYLLLGGEKSGV